MRILVLSDLHLEFDEGLRIPPGARPDVAVLAGDIWSDERGVSWALATFSCPVVYVPGNHEFYGREIGDVRRRLAAAARGTRVHVLDDREVIIEGVRFVGSTLWTDFALDGDRARAMAAAHLGMTDFRLVRIDDRVGDGPRPFTPADAAALHGAARRFLEQALARPHPGPTVVVTHHLPSSRSIAARWKGYILNGAFASNLDELLERHRPALWIHGHTHDSLDYRIGPTRVVCNPRGYLPREPNLGFDPGLVVEVEPTGASVLDLPLSDDEREA